MGKAIVEGQGSVKKKLIILMGGKKSINLRNVLRS
jgi:hypothetical protein